MMRQIRVILAVHSQIGIPMALEATMVVEDKAISAQKTDIFIDRINSPCLQTTPAIVTIIIDDVVAYSRLL